jgi:hypothetical protein
MKLTSLPRPRTMLSVSLYLLVNAVLGVSIVLREIFPSQIFILNSLLYSGDSGGGTGHLVLFGIFLNPWPLLSLKFTYGTGAQTYFAKCWDKYRETQSPVLHVVLWFFLIDSHLKGPPCSSCAIILPGPIPICLIHEAALIRETHRLFLCLGCGSSHLTPYFISVCSTQGRSECRLCERTAGFSSPWAQPTGTGLAGYHPWGSLGRNMQKRWLTWWSSHLYCLNHTMW